MLYRKSISGKHDHWPDAVNMNNIPQKLSYDLVVGVGDVEIKDNNNIPQKLSYDLVVGVGDVEIKDFDLSI